YDAAHVYYALMLLEKNGHLCRAAPEIPTDCAAFWSGLGLDASAALAALAEKPVALRPVGTVDLAPLHTALARLGIGIQPVTARRPGLVGGPH
ncbi:MAG: ribosomal protein methylthiotransferase accessory factor, partial [Pseudomonadota bacterium]|nr:ribosomal protein methylthiotransferase accessory factor [Pseudomonadota bacterium]